MTSEEEFYKELVRDPFAKDIKQSLSLLNEFDPDKNIIKKNSKKLNAPIHSMNESNGIISREEDMS